MEHTTVTAAEFAALPDLDDWRVVDDSIHAEFRAGSFPAAARLVVAVADAAEEADHHPDVDLRYPDRVRVTLTTHDAGGLTNLDVELARRISQLAGEAGASAESASR